MTQKKVVVMKVVNQYFIGRNRKNAKEIYSEHLSALVTLPQGFSLRDIFGVSTAGGSSSSSTSSTSSTVLPEETVELVLPERQFHQGYQSFNPIMVGVSSEEVNLPPPTQHFGVHKKQ